MTPQSEIRNLKSEVQGLTLIEVLAVVAILAVLAGLLLPAVVAVRRRARAVIAQTEVQTMETAWKNYYSAYEKWPSNTAEGVAFPIIGDRAAILMGSSIGADNPKCLTFLQFKRFDPDGHPVNPWWLPGIPPTNYYYYAKFDADHDRVIRAAAGPDDEPPADVSRRVIVWTRNPTIPLGEDGSMVRSWQP